MTEVTIGLFIIPVVLFAVALRIVKKGNSFGKKNGIDVPSARKSENNWLFAHLWGNYVITILSLVILVVTILSIVIAQMFDLYEYVWFLYFVQVLGVYISLILIEKKTAEFDTKCNALDSGAINAWRKDAEKIAEKRNIVGLLKEAPNITVLYDSKKRLC